MCLNVTQVVETGTIRKLRYGFLFAFHTNYGAILYRLRYTASFWSKMGKFLYRTLYLAPLKGVSPSDFDEDVCYS